MKRHWYAILFSAVLLCFTTYIALDTFVLGRAYQGGATEMNLALFRETQQAAAPQAAPETIAAPTAETTETLTTAEPAEAAGSTEPPAQSQTEAAASEAEEPETGFLPVDAGDGTVIGTYTDDNMQVTLVQYERYDTVVYAADVQLTSAEYLKTAFAQDTYGKNITQKTSEIAAAHGAILAVNGDYYGTQESGYVIRNGVIYRDSAKRGTDVLCVYADGTMEVVSGEEKTAQELLESGVWQAFSFGPALLQTGEIAVSETEEVGKAMASNPRTAIGMIAPLHYVLVVSDGRTEESQGLSLYQLAEFMQSLGITTAYNLDGGGSSTMVFEGELVNKPTSGGSSIKERSVSDIVYIG